MAERLADLGWCNDGEGRRALAAGAAFHRGDIRRGVGPDSRGRSGNGHAVSTTPERGQRHPAQRNLRGCERHGGGGQPADVTGPIAVMPAGRLSIKLTPVNASVVLGFVSAN